MKFNVKKADLVRGLSLMSGVIAKRSTIPILANVKLEARLGTLRISGTDLSTSLIVPVSVDVHTPGVSTLPLDRLLACVRLLPEGDISFSFGENGWATITAGRNRTRIAGITADSFPELPAVPESTFTVHASVLAKLINRVRFAITTIESRFTMNGALLQVEPGPDTESIPATVAVRMVATDGHRLAYAEAVGIGLKFSAIVAVSALVNIVKLVEKSDSVVTVGQDDNHLFFQVEGAILVSRKLAGNFPDYGRVLPQDAPTRITINRADLTGAIDRVTKFADERSHAIRLTITDSLATLEAATADVGDSSESVNCDYSGTEYNTGINAEYVTDFLSVASSPNITLHLSDHKAMLEFQEEGDATYRYVVMPMRI